ncbi:MAG: phosphoglycerate kinase [Chloroflexi bacterium]|nr:phosphoglycerate kinase [Chloroflexota bacterium]
MGLDVRTLDDFDVQGKTVLLRVDINSPINHETKIIKDDTRISRCMPTIKELSDKGAKLVILAHQADPLEYENFIMLEQHAAIISRLLGKPVEYLDDVAGPGARERIRSLKPGEILLLENVRIHTEETIIFEEQVQLPPEEQAKTYVVRHLAPLADLYVCDAFAAAHRSEPTLVGFQELLPSAAGRLFEEEMRALTAVLGNPQRPCLFVLGGAKILDAFKMMRVALESGAADGVLTAGLTGQIMLMAAGYSLGPDNEKFLEGKNLLQFLEQAKELLANFGDRLHFPVDVAVVAGGQRREADRSNLPVSGPIVDVGHGTVADYSARIAAAKTIFINGPAGVYEKEISAYGTQAIWKALAESPAYTVIGGGDSISAGKKFKVLDSFSYVCTAGGGLVRFLAGEPLAVVEALRKAAKRG